jgi:hypothetical protein
MLKTISAALLAATVIAAPAFAAETGKTTTTQAPVIKADPAQTKAAVTGKSDVKSDVKADLKADTKTKAMNANAGIGTEHKATRSHRHHGKTVSARKVQPDLSKPMAPAATDKRS